MLIYAEALLADIETAIIGAVCTVDRAFVSAGPPPAPNPGCVDAAVWISQIEDDNLLVPGECRVKTTLTLSWRINACYQESANGPTPEQHLEAAECFYDLLDAIWCYLVALHDDGTIAGIEGVCQDSRIGPVTVSRGGGIATGGGEVVVEYDCPTPVS